MGGRIVHPASGLIQGCEMNINGTVRVQGSSVAGLHPGIRLPYSKDCVFHQMSANGSCMGQSMLWEKTWSTKGVGLGGRRVMDKSAQNMEHRRGHVTAPTLVR